MFRSTSFHSYQAVAGTRQRALLALEDRATPWAPFVSEYQQRQLRCIPGGREGEVIHDPRLDKDAGTISTSDPVQPARNPWADGLESKRFWEWRSQGPHALCIKRPTHTQINWIRGYHG